MRVMDDEDGKDRDDEGGLEYSDDVEDDDNSYSVCDDYDDLDVFIDNDNRLLLVTVMTGMAVKKTMIWGRWLQCISVYQL